MTTLLARQAEAFRQEHGITESVSKRQLPPPSILFTPAEAKSHDEGAFAALARQGLDAMAALEPDVAALAPLFSGPMKDRETMARDEHNRLNGELRRLLLLLSPHLQVRAAQEVMEGLLQRYHIHKWNVEDVLASMLPYHDSPMFTRILEGLHVKGNKQWGWLETLKQKPATLVRSALAKYCSKDSAVLISIGDTLMESAKLQKSNRPLASLFIAVWLDTLTIAKSVSPDSVVAVVQVLQTLLRRPHLRDYFHAALIVTVALCTKVDLDSGLLGQLLERLAKQVHGEHSRIAMAGLAIIMQLQGDGVLPDKVLSNLASVGGETVLGCLPAGLDCRNLLASMLDSSLRKVASTSGEEASTNQGLANSLLAESTLEEYAEPLALAAMHAFSKTTGLSTSKEGEDKAATEAARPVLEKLGAHQPRALGAALRQAIGAAAHCGLGVGPLVRLVAPSCAVLPSPAQSTDEAGVIPVVQALGDKSAKVRAKAVLQAVRHLEASGEKGAEQESQQLFASLVLQATEDKSPEVVGNALQSQEFWANQAQLEGAAAVHALESLLVRLFANVKPRGTTLGEVFSATMLSEPQVVKLVPQALRCASWVHGRADCEDSVRQRLDAFLLPLVVLCTLGSDAVAADKAMSREQQKELRVAVKQYCSKSTHKLLSSLAASGNAASSPEALAKAADVAAAMQLCSIVDGGYRPAEASPQVLLGGAASQLAGAALLAAALPSLAQGSMPQAGQLTTVAVQACQQLAWQQSLTEQHEGTCLESVRKLLRAAAVSVAALDSPKGGTDSDKKKKKRLSGGLDSSSAVDLVELVQALLQVALRRPRSFTRELQQLLEVRGALLRPALYRLALSPNQASLGAGDAYDPAAVANAILLIKSFLMADDAGIWAPDHSLVVPLLWRLASSEAKEVRVAVLQLLDALRSADWEKHTDKDSPCAVALQAAGVLRPTHDVLPAEAWQVAADQSLRMTNLPAPVVVAFLEHIAAHRAEILQDRSAAALMLGKFLTGKVASVKGEARIAACTFWGVGISMLDCHVTMDSPSLLSAVPTATFLGSIKGVLHASMKETLSTLDGGAVSRAPELLRVAASSALAIAQTAASGGGSDKTKSTKKDTIEEFLRQVALPFCVGLAERFEKAVREVSNSTVELLQLLCQIMCFAIKSSCASGLQQEIAVTLLRVSVATHAKLTDTAGDEAQAEAPEAAAEVEPAAPAKSHCLSAATSGALADAALTPELLHHVLATSQTFKVKQLNKERGVIAAEVFCGQVASLPGAGPGSGALLIALGKVSQEVAAQQASKLAAGKDVAAGSTPTPTLLHLIQAVAALSEILSAAGASGEGFGEGANSAAEVVKTVCSSLAEVCAALGGHLSTGMLTTVIRSCGALALLSPPQDAIERQKVSLPSTMPFPLQTCLKGLQSYATRMGPDVVGMLKMNLERMWRYPETSAASQPSSAAPWDAVAQGRMCCLLHKAMSEPLLLAEEADATFCLSMAQSAGLQASLGFVVLMFISRKIEEPPQTSKKKTKKQKRKKRTDEEEILDAIMPAQDEHADTIADDALVMLGKADTASRFHGWGMLVQTLCSLAAELRRLQRPEKKGPTLCWGLKLLPENFADGLGVERLLPILEVGLAIAYRFVSEYGIPANLDEPDFDGSQVRCSISSDSAELQIGAVVVNAFCYALWAACAVDVTISDVSMPEVQGLQACRKQSLDLRALLMRSIAVNHPLTFFRALCLMLQVPGFHPAPTSGDIFSDSEFSAAVVTCAMRAAGEALQDRRELHSKEDSEEVAMDDGSCGPLCAAIIQHVCAKFLNKSQADSDESLQEVAWNFMEQLCWFSSKMTPEPVLETCMASAVACLSEQKQRGRDAGVRVAVACCSCVQIVVEQLGRGIMECLGSLMPPLLELASAEAVPAASDDTATAPLDDRVLQVLRALVKAVGAFLSPFLERLLHLTSALCQPSRLSKLEELGRDLVAHVPARLLVPAIQQFVSSVAKSMGSVAEKEAIEGHIDTSLVRLQRLATFQIWIFSEATPEFVGTIADATFTACLQLFAGGCKAATHFLQIAEHAEDLQFKVLRRGLPTLQDSGGISGKKAWMNCCAQGAVLQLNQVTAGAFTQFALRRDLDALRPCCIKALEWARDSQVSMLSSQASRKSATEEELRADTERACRALAVGTMLKSLALEAPGISEELLLPLAAKDIGSCISASRQCALRLASANKSSSRKRRKSASGAPISVADARSELEVLKDHTWWWLDVAEVMLGFVATALRPPSGEATGTPPSKAIEEIVDSFLDPCANMFDVFEFLSPAEGSAEVEALQQVLQNAIVALAFASESTKVKTVFTTVLGKSRSDDVEVRLCAVRSCHKIWSELGVQVVSGLSEVVMFASELLEDEDARVEKAVRLLIKTIEDCTGENLQEALKK